MKKLISALKKATSALQFVMRKNITSYERMLAINENNQVIELTVGTGTINSATWSLAPILRNESFRKSKQIIVCHNHPKGTLAPSGADIRSTEKLRVWAKKFNLNIIDHVIITPSNEYWSFAQHGKFNFAA